MSENSKNTLPKNDIDSDTEECTNQPVRSLGLDLGDDCVYNVEANRLGSATQPDASGTSSVAPNQKREDNPFSFKHFLRDSSSSTKNYQSLGARPKVYRDNRATHVSPPENSHRSSHNPRKVAELSSALPDFVQDHLVIEQCYLGSPRGNKSLNCDLDLQNFAQIDQRPPSGPTVSRSSSMDEPVGGPIPLDLPGLSLENPFPLDLPYTTNVSLIDPVRTCSAAEVSASKSLPDFLTDGPVRSSGDGLRPSTPTQSPSSTEADSSSGLAARCPHCSLLREELALVRQRASRAEDEANRNSRKASITENALIKLKQEFKTLKTQFRQLQSENDTLRSSMGAATMGASCNYEVPAPRLAQELRAAATTAEHSLRSLLVGVDNLRMMAATLENMHRIEEKTNGFSNPDEDRTGPAL